MNFSATNALIAIIFICLGYQLLVDISRVGFFAGFGLLSFPLNEVVHSYGFSALDVRNGHYSVFFTSIFLHIGILHFVLNMYSLKALGEYVEKFVGSYWMLMIFFISGISGNILTLILDFNSRSISAGASGAIFGLLGALIFFAVNERSQLYLKDYFSIDRNSLFFITLVNLYIEFTFNAVINNWAHLGGLFAGFICAYVFYFIKSKNFKKLV